MKKKIIMLLMAMSLVLTACGSVADIDRYINEKEESKQKEDEEKNENPYAFGTYTDTGYENASLGYRFTTPEGCMLADTEQLLDFAGYSMEDLSEDASEAMVEYAKQEEVYDLFAMYPLTGTSVFVIVLNDDTSLVNIDFFVEVTKHQLEADTTEDITVAPETEVVTIAGKDYSQIKTITVSEDETCYQEIYLLVEDGRYLDIMVTYHDENKAEAEALIEAFSEL